MKVLLVRHAKSFYDWSKYPTDPVRPLSEKGKKRQEAVSRGMKKNHLYFDLIWCSPYRRAFETLEIIQQVFNDSSEPSINRELTPGGDESIIYNLLQEQAKQTPQATLLIVSHNPLISMLLELLSSNKFSDDMRTSDVALCEIDQEKTSLIQFYPRAALMEKIDINS